MVGHIAFSPVALSEGSPDWYGAGPLSVLPALQRQGIGSALIRAGLERLKAAGARGCCLGGHPGYYERFGFIHPEGLGMAGVPADVFFALAFDGNYPGGTLDFHPAFFANGSRRAAVQIQLPERWFHGSCIYRRAGGLS